MTAGEELFVACLKRKDHKVLSVVQRKWLDGAEVRQYKFVIAGAYGEFGARSRIWFDRACTVEDFSQLGRCAYQQHIIRFEEYFTGILVGVDYIWRCLGC